VPSYCDLGAFGKVTGYEYSVVVSLIQPNTWQTGNGYFLAVNK